MKELPKVDVFFIRTPTEKGFFAIEKRLLELGFRKSAFSGQFKYSDYQEDTVIYVTDNAVFGYAGYNLYLDDYRHTPMLRINDLFE